MKKIKVRKVKQCSWGHSSSKWQSQNSNPCHLTSEPYLLITPIRFSSNTFPWLTVRTSFHSLSTCCVMHQTLLDVESTISLCPRCHLDPHFINKMLKLTWPSDTTRKSQSWNMKLSWLIAKLMLFTTIYYNLAAVLRISLLFNRWPWGQRKSPASEIRLSVF